MSQAALIQLFILDQVEIFCQRGILSGINLGWKDDRFTTVRIFLQSITRSLNSITYLPNMRMVKNFLWLYVLITILNLRSSMYMLGKTDTLQLSLMSP